MPKLSSRHHYIPKFYIKGYLNKDYRLFVYDIKKDKINLRNSSAKSIFYEWDRNSITLQNEKSTQLEFFYSRIDAICAPIIKILRDSKNQKGLLTTERIGLLKYFMMHLFWRIPYTDKAFQDINERTKHYFIDPKTNRKIKINSKLKEFLKSKDHEKLSRLNYVDKMIKETIEKYNYVDGESRAQLFGFNEDYFLLGDNPIIFRNIPTTFDELLLSHSLHSNIRSSSLMN